MKNIILLSLCLIRFTHVMSSFDNEDIMHETLEQEPTLLLICDDTIIPVENEEIFPLQDAIPCDLESFVDDLELDPIQEDLEVDTFLIPQEPENIEILDHAQEQDSDMMICSINQGVVDCVSLAMPETLNIDATDAILALDNGISMLQELKSQIIEQQNQADEVVNHDDDIVPVPHELINSVKKAAKKKKKLEEKERKEKYKNSKKSKKRNENS